MKEKLFPNFVLDMKDATSLASLAQLYYRCFSFSSTSAKVTWTNPRQPGIFQSHVPLCPPPNLIFQLVFLWCCSDLSKQAALHREGKNNRRTTREREESGKLFSTSMAEIPLQTKQTATVSLPLGNVWQAGRDQESFKKKKKRKKGICTLGDRARDVHFPLLS